MQTIKTAISLDKALFDQTESLAQAMNVSRSRLFAMALKDFFERRKNQELLAKINEAHIDEPDPAEQALKKASKRQHRRLVEGQW